MDCMAAVFILHFLIYLQEENMINIPKHKKNMKMIQGQECVYVYDV